MDIFFTIIFPILLIAGTFVLGYREVKSYLYFKTSSSSPLWYKKRFARRLVGLLLMTAIGVMILVGGHSVTPAASPIIYMKFWLACIMLVLCVLMLAIWDAVCEIRKIKEYVDEFHHHEVDELKKKIKIYYN